MLWAALAFAFAPSLQMWARELADSPPERIAALALVWLVLAWRAGAPAHSRPLAGALLLAAALVSQVAGLIVRVDGLAVSCLPLAFLGMSLWQGAPEPRGALLALWCVPIPASFVYLGSPALESLQATAGAAVATFLGATAVPHPGGPLFTAGSARLELGRLDAGYALAIALSAASWFGGALRGDHSWRMVSRTCLGALVAFPVQTVVVALAAAIAFSAGAPAAGQRFLLFAPWLLGGLLGVSLWWRTRREELKTPAERSDPPGGAKSR